MLGKDLRHGLLYSRNAHLRLHNKSHEFHSLEACQCSKYPTGFHANNFTAGRQAFRDVDTGQNAAVDGEEFVTQGGRIKKLHTTAQRLFCFVVFDCFCVFASDFLWVFYDMCNLEWGFWELQLIAGLPGEYHPHPRLRRHLYLGDQGVKNLEKVNHLGIFQGSDKQLQSVNGNLIMLVGCYQKGKQSLREGFQ